jgi:hypothetical protein
MAPLRRVFAERAGPTALGILVPPGPRTVLVVRPRALAWDLLLVEDGPDAEAVIRFCDVTRAEAEAAAERFGRALDGWAGDRPARVEPFPAPGCPGYCVRAMVGEFTLVACPRAPGRPYRPMVFASRDEAQQAADALANVLCPPPGASQEVYFNTRNFAR